MKLLFNLSVAEGRRVRAQPSDYLQSLPRDQQIREVTAFLRWAEDQERTNPDPAARAEAGIGIATAREFLNKLGNAPEPIVTRGNRDE